MAERQVGEPLRLRLGLALRVHELQLVSPAEAERVYTNDPASYPVPGRKPMQENRWSAQVIGRREVFLGRTLAEIAELFQDHELIGSLGCGAVLNVPVLYDGRVLGPVNVLDAEGRYDEAAAERGRWLAPLLVPALL